MHVGNLYQLKNIKAIHLFASKDINSFTAEIFHGPSLCHVIWVFPGIILCKGLANERWHYNVTLILTGRAHTQNGPCIHGISTPRSHQVASSETNPSKSNCSLHWCNPQVPSNFVKSIEPFWNRVFIFFISIQNHVAADSLASLLLLLSSNLAFEGLQESGVTPLW